MATDERIAVCPGSYDPVTNGHLDIIGRASKVFDKVIVGVVGKAIRKSKTLFTAEERREFLVEARRPTLANVEVGIFRNLLVEFARERGATADHQGSAGDLGLRVRARDEPAQPQAGAGDRVRCTSSRRPTTASSPRPGSRRWRRSAATSAISCRPPLRRRSAERALRT